MPYATQPSQYLRANESALYILGEVAFGVNSHFTFALADIQRLMSERVDLATHLLLEAWPNSSQSRRDAGDICLEYTRQWFHSKIYPAFHRSLPIVFQTFPTM